MTAADTIAKGIGARIVRQMALDKIPRDLEARVARDFIQGSAIGAILRQAQRAQRLRDRIACIEFVRAAGADRQQPLDAIHAQARLAELDALAKVRTQDRAQRHCRPSRHEHHPVRTRRCSRAPNDVSSLPLCPEVAT
jgi:hypothetical protein